MKPKKWRKTNTEAQSGKTELDGEKERVAVVDKRTCCDFRSSLSERALEKGGVQAQLHRELRVVPLVRRLDLSPDCRSTLGVMLRWFGLVLLARACSHFHRFCLCSSLPRQQRGWFFLNLPSAET